MASTSRHGPGQREYTLGNNFANAFQTGSQGGDPGEERSLERVVPKEEVADCLFVGRFGFVSGLVQAEDRRVCGQLASDLVGCNSA
jgi:hypothetical protein